MTEKEYRKLLKERFKDKKKLRSIYISFAKLKISGNITELKDFTVGKRYKHEFYEWFFNVQTSYKITKINKPDISVGMAIVYIDGNLEYVPFGFFRSLQRIKYSKSSHLDRHQTTCIELSYNFNNNNSSEKRKSIFRIYEYSFNNNVKLLHLAVTKLQLMGTLKLITSFYKNGLISKRLMDKLVTEHTLKHNEEISKYTLKENFLAEAGIEESELSKHYAVLLEKGYCDYAKKLRNVYHWIDD